MTPPELSAAIAGAVRAAIEAGEFPGPPTPDVVVERPKNHEHGDYTTNVAMRLAKTAGRPPREVAARIAIRLNDLPGIAAVDVAGPGFLNITFAAEALGQVALKVVRDGAAFGRNETQAGQSINLEFVSANPTGPVHLAHARWAAVGDSLNRILTASGARVTAEHYVNDAGSQVDKFARSLQAVAAGHDVAEDGYHGAYVFDVAAEVSAAHPEIVELTQDRAFAVFRAAGLQMMLADIERSLAAFRVHFDVWFSEQALHDSGAISAAIETLRGQGHVFDADGATWLRTSDFGDDKDRPLRKSDGDLTYFAADCAYYLDKRARGFAPCIYMLGPDHHGYVGRLKTIASCAGDDPGRTLQVLIGQTVKLLRDGQEVKLSKRAGTIVTLDELVEMVGVDAARYTLSRWSTDTPVTIDVAEVTRKSSENPVFYVQYAHARLSSLQRSAVALGIVRSDSPDLGLLVHERESVLLGALGDFPRVVAGAAELRAPHRVARYLEELAGTYHRFYDACRVLPQGDEVPTALTDARLWLCEATRIVLANGLDLLGVTAPERM